MLAVEVGEGIAGLLGRATELRQWGRHRSARRMGVAVLARDSMLGPAVADIAAGGLAGLAVIGERSPVAEQAAKEANRLGMFMVMLKALQGERAGK